MSYPETNNVLYVMDSTGHTAHPTWWHGLPWTERDQAISDRWANLLIAKEENRRGRKMTDFEVADELSSYDWWDRTKDILLRHKEPIE